MQRLHLTDTERELIKRRAVEHRDDIPFFNFCKYWDSADKALSFGGGGVMYALMCLLCIGGWPITGVFALTIAIVCAIALPVLVRTGIYVVNQHKLAVKYRHAYHGASISYFNNRDRSPGGFRLTSSVDAIWDKAKCCKRQPELLIALAKLCADLTLTLMDLPDADSFADDERVAVQQMLDDRFTSANNLADAIVQYEQNSESLDTRVVAQRFVQEAEAWNKLRAAGAIPTDSLTEALDECSEKLKGAAINLSKSK